MKPIRGGRRSLAPIDPDEAPELTDEQLSQGVVFGPNATNEEIAAAFKGPSDLARLEREADKLGFALVEKDRIKRLNVAEEIDAMPLGGFSDRDLLEVVYENLLRQVGAALAAKLREFDKYLIEITPREHFKQRLSIALDVIVPRQKGGPR